jgi:pimeloyl-ACP methyl ester carboxylesterase
VNDAERSDVVAQLTRAFGVPHRRDEPRLAAALESVERVDVRYEDGVVAAWRVGPGPAVVLVHGREDDHSLWAPLIDELARRGRSFVAFDMPAHGLSSGEWGLYPEAADAIHALVAVLGPFDAVVSHSSGCGTAGLVLHEGITVDRAVFVAPPMRSVNRWDRYAERFGFPDDVARAAEAAYVARIGPARAGFDLRDELPRLDVELLVVHSRDDERMPFADSEEIVPRARRGALLAVDGLTHRRTARDPDVVARIADFVCS